MPRKHGTFECQHEEASKNYARCHVDEWYKFFNEKGGKGIRNEDLYFITGGHKTYEWYTATVYKNSKKSKGSFAFRGFKGIGAAASGELFYKLASLATPFRGPDEETSVQNQCTVVRGYRLRVHRLRLFGQHTSKKPREIDASGRRSGLLSWVPHHQHFSEHTISGNANDLRPGAAFQPAPSYPEPTTVAVASLPFGHGETVYAAVEPDNTVPESEVASTTSTDDLEPASEESDDETDDDYTSAYGGDDNASDESPPPGSGPGSSGSGGASSDFASDNDPSAGGGNGYTDSGEGDNGLERTHQSSGDGDQDHAEENSKRKRVCILLVFWGRRR